MKQFQRNPISSAQSQRWNPPSPKIKTGVQKRMKRLLRLQRKLKTLLMTMHPARRKEARRLPELSSRETKPREEAEEEEEVPEEVTTTRKA